MSPWFHLALAIVSEVIGTSALKASDGFTRPVPTLIVAVGYAIAFYCLSIVLRSVPVGVAYAIWSGAGITLIALVGWMFHGQSLDMPAVLGMGLIVAGVLVLNLFSKTVPHG
ncbi:MAG: QacE family quaternary ammonium compound efflux SMR transporter [Candidatus Accumulibacter sp.]|jgi:small multidrug resistance pump|nr:QacE family quaternary ammonium compound efflux SMR transporter [Accumulibacter sp.]